MGWSNLFHNVIELNMPVVYFVYGLVFFASGIGISVRFWQADFFSFGKELWLLGLFGLLHGASEWGYLFIPVQEVYLSQKIIYILYALRTLLGATSFLVLLIFGLRLLFPQIFWAHNILPVLIFSFWFAFFLFRISHHNELSLLPEETLARYILGFPSSLLTSLAFFKQSKEALKLDKAPDMIRYIRSLALVFLFYAIFAGLVVSKDSYFPANLVNTGWFYHLTDIPVQIFRAVCGTFMMIYALRLLGAFNREAESLLFLAKEDSLKMAERERISKDLHDGVIQSLYVAELMIENCQYKLGPDSPVQSDLKEGMKTLDSAMQDLRKYIMGLKNNTIFQQTLECVLLQAIDEFERDCHIVINFRFEVDTALHLAPNRQNHLYYVIKELLNNVAKHAQADKVEILVKEYKRRLKISLADNGLGIPSEMLEEGRSVGLGLQHIRERIIILRGKVEFRTYTQGGTEVTLDIPKEA